MNSTIKTVVFWLVILISAFLLWQVVQAPQTQPKTPEISYSEFLSQVDTGNVVKVTISQSQVRGMYRDKSSFLVIAPTYQGDMLEELRRNKVEIWVKDTSNGGWTMQLLGTWAPLIVLAGLWFYMIRRIQTKRSSEVENRISSNANSSLTGK